MNREEIAWAAGLFEGEGCFSARTDGRPNTMGLASTDEDVVRRFHDTVGVGHVNGPYGPYATSAGSKPYWMWSSTRFEHKQHIVAMFWPWLGERRKAAAKVHLKDNWRRPRGWAYDKTYG